MGPGRGTEKLVKAETRLPVALRGYDRSQVNTLLERIGARSVTADDVRRTRFDVVLRGYDQRAVDQVLQEAIRELQSSAPVADRPRRPRVHPGWLINWIQSAKFRGSGMHAGYSVRDVDAFLDRVVAGLRGYAPPMTARDVREGAFRIVWIGHAYDETEVDGFLLQLAAALERH